MTTVTTRPDKPPTLMYYYPQLKASDRALILRAYNQWRIKAATEPQGPEAHFGLLPFISMHKIGTALTWKNANEPIRNRIWAELCSKVEATRWANAPNYPAHMGWELILNSASVYKHFGRRPELGVLLPMIPKEKTRGPLKWNIGAKAWQPEKIQAAPRITLRKLRDLPDTYQMTPCKGHGMWLLHAPARYKELCIGWLMDHCA